MLSGSSLVSRNAPYLCHRTYAPSMLHADRRKLTRKSVAVKFHKEGLTFTGDGSPMANLLLLMLGAVAEFERALIRERQREGIAVAKERAPE